MKTGLHLSSERPVLCLYEMYNYVAKSLPLEHVSTVNENEKRSSRPVMSLYILGSSLLSVNDRVV